MTSNSKIQVDYTTNDGMNFTNMNGEQTIDFGVKIGFNPDMWDDKLGYFMVIPGEKQPEINDASYLFYKGVRVDDYKNIL